MIDQAFAQEDIAGACRHAEAGVRVGKLCLQT
jgi:hypothetical protein